MLHSRQRRRACIRWREMLPHVAVMPVSKVEGGLLSVGFLAKEGIPTSLQSASGDARSALRLRPAAADGRREEEKEAWTASGPAN